MAIRIIDGAGEKRETGGAGRRGAANPPGGQPAGNQLGLKEDEATK